MAPAPCEAGSLLAGTLCGCCSPGAVSVPAVPFVGAVVPWQECPGRRTLAWPGEGGCPRGKEEKTTVPSLNRRSKGRFWCIRQQAASRFTDWVPLQNSCQHFVCAPHAHLELQKLSSLLSFPVLIINAAVRPSNPRHRGCSVLSAQDQPAHRRVTAPGTSQHPEPFPPRVGHSSQQCREVQLPQRRWPGLLWAPGAAW